MRLLPRSMLTSRGYDMQVKQDRAIILGKTKYGEADLILRVLTSKGDVFSVMAKSALKSKKRFGGGVLEPTHFVNITYHLRPEQEERMAILSEASLVEGFAKLRTDYDRLQTAFHFIRLVATVTREGDTNKENFDLLGHSLRATESSNNLRLLRVIFDLKLLQLQGILPPDPDFAPLLKKSVRDANELNEEQFPQLSDVRLKIDIMMNQYLGYSLQL